jgi:membrane protein implicated in regulation of membrane protease activity
LELSSVTGLHVLFLIAFIGGLILAVFAMLHGVEYTRPNRSRAPSPVFNLPAIAAFAVAFGAVGYPIASRTSLSGFATILIAAASGVVATVGMIVLLSRWALRDGYSTSSDAEDIQGVFATVTAAITSTGQGEISYEYLGKNFHATARALSEKSLAVGAEVVIDRIEHGVAYVEEWAVVEQRL